MRAYIEILEKENISLAEQIDTIRNIKTSYSEPYSDHFNSSNPRTFLSNQRASGGRLQT